MFKISKKFFTASVLNVARYVPFIFPESVVYFSKEHNKKRDKNYLKSDENIETISYFSGEFKWKAITLSSIITKSDVSIIEEKMDKLQVCYLPNRFSKLSETTIENHGCYSHTLGVFRVNSDPKFNDLGSLYLKSDYFSAVYLSIFKTPSGLFIITYYFYMAENATSLITDIDVSNLRLLKEFAGFNIYKRKNRTLNHVFKKAQATDIIENNLSMVLNEAKEIVGYIGDKICISPTDFLCTSEFYKDQDEPYFTNQSEGFQSRNIAYVEPRYFDVHEYSADCAEHFFSTELYKKNIFDFSYLLCKRHERFEEFDDYTKRYYACYEKHMAFVPLYLIHRKITGLVSKISSVITIDKGSDLAKHHDVVYECLSQAETLKKWIKEIENDYKYSTDEEYHDSISSILTTQNERVNELLESAKMFYSLSENRVQVANIKYSKKNSIVVLILVIVQIFLAAMTIDFGKKDQWYSPLVEHIKQLS